MPSVQAETIVRADLETVYQFAREVERFPEFVRDVESVRVLEREGNTVVSEWHAIVPQFHRKVHWVERDVWDDTSHTCRFELVRGDFDKYAGVWSFEPHPDGSRMVLTIDYEYNVPLIGALIQKVVFNAMRDNAQATLDGIRAAVEKERH